MNIPKKQAGHKKKIPQSNAEPGTLTCKHYECSGADLHSTLFTLLEISMQKITVQYSAECAHTGRRDRQLHPEVQTVIIREQYPEYNNSTEIRIPVAKIFKSLSDFFCSDDFETKVRNTRVPPMSQLDKFEACILFHLKRTFPDMVFYDNGRLKSPDIIVGSDWGFMGIEVKKLYCNINGRTSRGRTMDFNSTMPCGATPVTINGKQYRIPLFYLACSLIEGESRIHTMVLLDGSVLSNCFKSHIEAKTKNYSTHNHGTYGDGNIRHRLMYSCPNVLDHNIKQLNGKHSLVVNAAIDEIETLHLQTTFTRKRQSGHPDLYGIYNTARPDEPPEHIDSIFPEITRRTERTLLLPKIEVDQTQEQWRISQKMQELAAV